MEINNTAQVLIYLLRCALHNTPPEAIPELDHDALYSLSEFHSVTAITAMALESGGLLTEPFAQAEAIKRWNEARIKAIRKNILLDAQRTKILQYMDEQGIWYLPLKGCILKDMYPKMGMRQMADNDILFDRDHQHQLRRYMEQQGYTAVVFEQGAHDTYEKLPIYNFEFHTSLFDPYAHPEWAAHYDNLIQRLVKDPENAFGYHFTDEDFYIYILLHAYKHYSTGGTGIRLLLDLYVFLNQKYKSLDWDYIHAELQTLQIDTFEALSKGLALKLFERDEQQELGCEESELLDYLMGSGTYGTTENRVNHALDELRTHDEALSVRTKTKYALRRLFPDKKFMQQYDPFCRRHEWSIPFFWIYRLIKSAIFRRKAIHAELQAMKKAK